MSEELTAFLRGARIADEMLALRPDYRALLVAVDGLEPGESDERSEALLVQAEAAAADAMADSPVTELPHVAAWREAYRAFGAKPQRTRNSLEALLRRAATGLPRVNRLTDLYNAICVRHQIPLGGEDLARYVGPPRLLRATGDEPFDTASGGESVIEHPEPGEVVWADDAGVTCRRWNWRQCRRTQLTDATTSALFILDALEPVDDDALRAAGDELAGHLRRLGPRVEVAQRLLPEPETRLGAAPRVAAMSQATPPPSSLPLGAHVDQEDPIAQAAQRGADLVQIFLGDPQSYKGPVVRYDGGADALKAAAHKAGIDLYVHAPYPINVASTNNRIRIPGRKLLQQHLTAAAQIGAKGVVVHGGHLGKTDDAAKGFDNWRKCIDGLDMPVPLLIENTAGGDNAMARHLEAIAKLWDAIGAATGGDTVGFCLDTCHAHAGGNDLGTLVEQVRAITGRIDLVHANDSRDAFDSGADRHTNLGAGHIDPGDLADVVRAAGAPVVVETPGGEQAQAADLAWLRERL